MTDFHELPAGVVVLERGWLSANNVVLTGPYGSAVVDTGYSTHATQTVELVELALAGRDLDLVVNTHLHSDHCGGNAALQLRYKAVQTAIPAGQSRHVANWDPEALSYTPTGQHCPQFRFDQLLRHGDAIRMGNATWQVHAAPGHDPHSIILWEPETRTLISADALWENGFGVVFPELEGDDGYAEVAQTLDLIESLSPLTVIPGHGRVFSDVSLALSVARSRLSAFVRDPVKHASHAAKVLLKFKLLEVQEIERDVLFEWAMQTRYFQSVKARHHAQLDVLPWLEDLASSLVRSGAAVMNGTSIHNA